MSIKTVSKLLPLVQSARPPFLVLAPVCVFLGASTAAASGANVNWALLPLVVCAAVFAHISVNAFNEYFDFKSGLDLLTRRTPFSGGSGALPAAPHASAGVLALALSSLILTMFIGIYLVSVQGWLLFTLGALGVILIATYTPWINRHPILCLIAPGLGFGVCIVAGTHLALTGQATTQLAMAALVPFFLVNNLLLLNQYPDLEADRAVQRRHLPIAYGLRVSTAVYALFASAAFISVGLGVVLDVFPRLSLVALLPLPLMWFSWRAALRYDADLGSHPAYLAGNVVLTLLTPTLLALSLWQTFAKD